MIQACVTYLDLPFESCQLIDHKIYSPAINIGLGFVDLGLLGGVRT